MPAMLRQDVDEAALALAEASVAWGSGGSMPVGRPRNQKLLACLGFLDVSTRSPHVVQFVYQGRGWHGNRAGLLFPAIGHGGAVAQHTIPVFMKPFLSAQISDFCQASLNAICTPSET